LPTLQQSTKQRSEHGQISNYTLPLSRDLAIRVYSDTRPRNWRISGLQKGLILVFGGRETVGEGTGFGAPILLYKDETYFSGSSNVYVSKQQESVIVRKEFFMDRILRETFRNVRLENPKIRNRFKNLGRLYQEHGGPWFLQLKSLLFRYGIKPNFITVAMKGEVTVTYSIMRNRIRVNADFSEVEKDDLHRVFLMNEQSSMFFDKYEVSDGTSWDNIQVGPWDQVTNKYARIMNTKNDIGFRLETKDGCVLRCGREFLKGHLDWTGLDYEINPKIPIFEYDIEIIGG
jgi:hypothetical protein